MSLLQADSSTADTNVYTFSAQNLGAAASNRYIVVAIGARKSVAANTTISSVTIGGESATYIIERAAAASSASNHSAIYAASVPSGTTGDVVITFADTMLRCGIALYRETDISLTAHDTDVGVGTTAMAIDVDTNGIVIGCGFSAANTTASWSGMDSDAYINIESNVTFSYGTHVGTTPESARALNTTFGTNTNTVKCAASFARTAAGSSIPFPLIGSGALVGQHRGFAA